MQLRNLVFNMQQIISRFVTGDKLIIITKNYAIVVSLLDFNRNLLDANIINFMCLSMGR